MTDDELIMIIILIKLVIIRGGDQLILVIILIPVVMIGVMVN